jgi:hypothetical protein
MILLTLLQDDGCTIISNAFAHSRGTAEEGLMHRSIAFIIAALLVASAQQA